MLRTLRIKLTLLYLAAGLGMVVMIGGGAYFLIERYLRNTTDLSLQYKMAAEFRLLGISMPQELESAEQSWLQNNSRVVNHGNSLITLIMPDYIVTNSDEEYESYPYDDNDLDDYEDDVYFEREEAHHFEADLAAVFTIPYAEDMSPILPENLTKPPITENFEIFSAARSSGFDLRTLDISGIGRVRLLTYSTGAEIPAFLQTGRLLNDQDLLLYQYLSTLIILASVTSIVLGAGSWWLAGRSLGPAQRAWSQQQTFVSNASHELRSPLTFIRASADYALHAKNADESLVMLSDILGECDYMDRLVDDLLLLSRLDAGKLQLEHEKIALSPMLSEILRQIEKMNTQPDARINVDVDDIYVQADRNRLRQVLIILLDNALRYTSGSEQITVEAANREKWNVITVRDNGKGIAPEHLSHIFDRFYQVRDEEKENHRSNGLGLSIAKALVEAQGGTIEVTSTPGKGTAVSICFPRPTGIRTDSQK